MNGVIREVVLFILSFLFVFVLYQIFIVRRAKDKKKKNKIIKAKEPFEITYLKSKYKLDLSNINYKRLLMVISIVSSLDIALVVTIILSIKNYILSIVIGFISMIFIILISYHIVYLFYRRKGDVK